jgi:hypothetical protein
MSVHPSWFRPVFVAALQGGLQHVKQPEEGGGGGGGEEKDDKDKEEEEEEEGGNKAGGGSRVDVGDSSTSDGEEGRLEGLEEGEVSDTDREDPAISVCPCASAVALAKSTPAAASLGARLARVAASSDAWRFHAGRLTALRKLMGRLLSLSGCLDPSASPAPPPPATLAAPPPGWSGSTGAAAKKLSGAAAALRPMLDGRLQVIFPLVAGPHGAGHRHIQVQDAACDVIVLMGRLYGPEPILTSLSRYAQSDQDENQLAGGAPAPATAAAVGGGIKPNVLKKIVVAFNLRELEEAEGSSRPGSARPVVEPRGGGAMMGVLPSAPVQPPAAGMAGDGADSGPVSFNYDRAPPLWDSMVGSAKAPQWNHYRVL